MPNKQSYLGEFEHFVLLSIASLKEQAYGVSKSMSRSWRFLMTKQRVYSALLVAFCVSVVAMLIIAINFLSVAESSVFQQAYWTNGHIHQLFFAPELWQSVGAGLLSHFSLVMLFHVDAIIYAVLSFSLVYALDKKYLFSSTTFALSALVIVLIPYIGGFVYFQVNEVALKQSGPVIALMWLSVLYLMPPLTYCLMNKRYHIDQPS
ncbi:hypothetical protein [Paraglaciecola hydrolytica]|uniref:Uncharacterized protein n=1 Tax=Paraglaciecola hydrolytica TaxID=1799789 RepID=A0A136A078_9ALTE|nr:hypothetical protein [Paraglaciecola hydrolytica]KXI28631.1 hypothetical protein AX660_16230 [Paraglaciecola hydrolytica]